jgi:hypothetical protein
MRRFPIMHLVVHPLKLGGLAAQWLLTILRRPVDGSGHRDGAPYPDLTWAHPRAPGLIQERVPEMIVTTIVGSVDTLVSAVPNPVPSAGQLRQARDLSAAQLDRLTRPARRPVLAGLGTADLIRYRWRTTMAETFR